MRLGGAVGLPGNRGWRISLPSYRPVGNASRCAGSEVQAEACIEVRLPKRPRIDPPAGSTAGYRPLDAVKGRDPSRHYVYANPNDAITGQPVYESMGYEVETYRKDGPRPLVGMFREGQPITALGGPVLMSAPIEVFEDAQRYASDVSDQIAKRIKAPLKDKELDGYRGDETFQAHASVQEDR